jgi:ubiquinone/menaquinone biosynthesis C-methylase UbiE
MKLMPFKNLGNLLWELYPYFYDRMRIFPAYKEMMEKTVDGLSPKKGGVYLDLGCGTGNLVMLLSLRGATVYGLDSSFSALKVAYSKIEKQKSAKSAKLYFFKFEDKLPFKDRSLDGIAAVNLICYLKPSAVQKLVKESNRVLRKGGKICLVYPKNITYSKGLDDFKLLLKTEPKQALTSIPFYLVVGIMNLPMKLKTNITYYPKTYIESLLSKTGFKNIKTGQTYYGKTTLLTIAEKP